MVKTAKIHREEQLKLQVLSALANYADHTLSNKEVMNCVGGKGEFSRLFKGWVLLDDIRAYLGMNEDTFNSKAYIYLNQKFIQPRYKGHPDGPLVYCENVNGKWVKKAKSAYRLKRDWYTWRKLYISLQGKFRRGDALTNTIYSKDVLAKESHRFGEVDIEALATLNPDLLLLFLRDPKRGEDVVKKTLTTIKGLYPHPVDPSGLEFVNFIAHCSSLLKGNLFMDLLPKKIKREGLPCTKIHMVCEGFIDPMGDMLTKNVTNLVKNKKEVKAKKKWKRQGESSTR